MKQAFIDAKDFNRMIKNLKKALRAPLTTSTEEGRNFLAELIHLDFSNGSVKCVACDGYRVHEETFPAKADEDFVCHITPPQLKAAGTVKVSLDESVAYIEFDNIRFATKQPTYELTVLGSGKIRELIGDDERFEVAVNPKYLLDAVNALKNERQIVLNVGHPMRPIVLYPSSGWGEKFYGVLPSRRPMQFGSGSKTISEQRREEQLNKLKIIRNRLSDVLTNEVAGGEQEADVLEKARSLVASLDNLFKEGDCA